MSSPKRRKQPPFPSPIELERMVRELCQDALAIYPLYRRLHGLGLEAPSMGEQVKVSGSGELTQPEAIVDSAHAESRRNYARWVAGEIGKAQTAMFKLRQGLERSVGQTFRQSETLGSDAIVTMDQYLESVEKRRERAKAGVE